MPPPPPTPPQEISAISPSARQILASNPRRRGTRLFCPIPIIPITSSQATVKEGRIFARLNFASGRSRSTTLTVPSGGRVPDCVPRFGPIVVMASVTLVAFESAAIAAGVNWQPVITGRFTH